MNCQITDETLKVDVRVIAATNRNLKTEIERGAFREDLYYRLSVIPIQLPPLRERRDDIPLLARAFLERFRKSMEKPIEGISPEAMHLLEAYDWPGNVRELENTMERSVALETGKLISVAVLPEKVSRQGVEPVDTSAVPSNSDNGPRQLPEGGLDLVKHMQEMEKAYIVAALEACGGVGTRAAELLRMSYRSFRHYSKKYSIS